MTIGSETLAFVAEYITDNGYPPTRKEIAERFSISANAAQLRLRTLERRGKISISPGISRGIRVKKA